ncbi:DUF6471 domain-containing protein [Paraburkholderia terrae]|uniref:DUF6471 domain-containing protein n=1 Tax=Paraburkholderia terrae TaxID=311230 RepID=UPI00296A9CD2|nr:DUF6471 domain-containing protein [Paraburkholderia terrae]MDW3662556.1 DUF6471 domain-containing protein [Paraburkholderia terrae]
MRAPRKNQGPPESSHLEDADFSEAARRALKTIIGVRDITYAQLAARLTALGVPETESSIAQKVRRGTFQLAFFLQCMRAIEVSEVTLTVPKAGAPTVARV